MEKWSSREKGFFPESLYSFGERKTDKCKQSNKVISHSDDCCELPNRIPAERVLTALPRVIREGLWEDITFEPNCRWCEGTLNAKFGSLQDSKSMGLCVLKRTVLF